MKAHMTNGTWDFLQRVAEKNKQYQFFFMLSETSNSTLAYYETDSSARSVFAAGRSYEILLKSGDLQEEGFFVMNNIPLTEEGIPVFENRFKNKQNHLDYVQGFIAFRLFRPLKDQTYVIFTQWASKDEYEQWRESDNFIELFDDQQVKRPAYFSSRPFVMHYSLFYEEEDDEDDLEATEDGDGIVEEEYDDEW